MRSPESPERKEVLARTKEEKEPWGLETKLEGQTGLKSKREVRAHRSGDWGGWRHQEPGTCRPAPVPAQRLSPSPFYEFLLRPGGPGVSRVWLQLDVPPEASGSIIT